MRWKQLLDCILFLAERNLPLRGKNALIGNPRNGNFLGLIKLLARYDNVMAQHIQKISTEKKVYFIFKLVYTKLILKMHRRLCVR